MKTQQNSQTTGEVKPQPQEPKRDHQNNQETDAPVADSGSVSVSSSDSRKVTREDIELVQNLIERCLQLYMNRGEVVKTLLNRARIEPGFTTLVWQKLEEENSDFFRAYYIRLKLKKQITLFNHFLEHQYHLMKYPVAPKVMPLQNGVHPTPGYPVLQQSPMPPACQPHIDSMNRGLSSCHVVNGIPAPGNYHHMHINTTNNNMMDRTAGQIAPAMPQCSGMSSVSEMVVSPKSGSSDHFPTVPSEISGMDMDTSALDTAFTSDVGNPVGLDLGIDGAGSSKDGLSGLGQIPWNFSFSELTADITNLEDLGALGNYSGSPFLPSDSDILLDSLENDEIVEDFFVDNVSGTCSDEDKS